MKSRLMEIYEEADATTRRRLDRQYKEFVAIQGCLLTHSPNVELHHYRILRSDMFGAGAGHRPPDIMCIPLHYSLHRTGNQAIHVIGNSNFQDTFGIDLYDELQRYHDRFLNDIGVR